MDKTIDGLNSLFGGSDTSSQLNYGYPGYPESSSCCDPTVDIMSVLVAIGTIAAVAVFLRQAVIDNNVMGAGRRKKRGFLQQGNKGNHFTKLEWFL